MSTAHRDQAFRDQPALFGRENEIVDHGKQSRNETFRNIADELPERCKIWLARIIFCREWGTTLDELSSAAGIPANEFSGRITELKKLGLIEHTAERRPTRKGSTAAVIVATELAKTKPTRQPELMQMTTKTKPACELPDAITNTAIPRDEDGRVIEHGMSYIVDGLGLLRVHYDFDVDEYYVHRVMPPGKRQPVSMLPPQTKAWRRIDA